VKDNDEDGKEEDDLNKHTAEGKAHLFVGRTVRRVVQHDKFNFLHRYLLVN
jgi:hypothetical protein